MPRCIQQPIGGDTDGIIMEGDRTMCTSLTLPLPDGSQLFGRTLDWHEHFHERVLHVPAGFAFSIGRRGRDEDLGIPPAGRYALLGMGTEAEGYPLFADAMNECGLCMAGLRFADAWYIPMNMEPPVPPMGAEDSSAWVRGLAPWELIPYIVGFCATVDEARAALQGVRLIDLPFPLVSGGSIPTSPLHWQISDSRADGGSLVLEMTAAGLKVYDDPLGVMANAPSFPEQLAGYEIRSRDGEGVPTGYTSGDRFCRAAALRTERGYALAAGIDSRPPADCFFAMAASVSPPEGAVPSVTGTGWQTTQYTACLDGARGIYRYTTAEDPTVHEVSFS